MKRAILLMIFLYSGFAYSQTICTRPMDGTESNEWLWKDCATKNFDGEFVLKPEFKKKLIFGKNGLAQMCFSDQKDSACYWLNKDLKSVRVQGLEGSANEFSQGLALHVDKKGKFGFVNEKLEIVIPAKYNEATPFQENGTSEVCIDCKPRKKLKDEQHETLCETKGTWLVIDKAGKTLKRCTPHICSCSDTIGKSSR